MTEETQIRKELMRLITLVDRMPHESEGRELLWDTYLYLGKLLEIGQNDNGE